MSITFTGTRRLIHRRRVRQRVSLFCTGRADREIVTRWCRGCLCQRLSDVSVGKQCGRRRQSKEKAYSSTRHWGICETSIRSIKCAGRRPSSRSVRKEEDPPAGVKRDAATADSHSLRLVLVAGILPARLGHLLLLQVDGRHRLRGALARERRFEAVSWRVRGGGVARRRFSNHINLCWALYYRSGESVSERESQRTDDIGGGEVAVHARAAGIRSHEQTAAWTIKLGSRRRNRHSLTNS